MGLLDLLSGVTDFFSGGPDVIDYAPSDFGATFAIPETVGGGLSDLGFTLGEGAAFDPFMAALDAGQTAVPFSLGATDFAGNALPAQFFTQDAGGLFVPIGTAADLATTGAGFPGFSPSLNLGSVGGGSSSSFSEALNALRRAAETGIGAARGGTSGGRVGGGLNTLLNLPPAEVPDVPKVTVPSLEGPPPPPAGAEPLPFKPLAMETTTPTQAPRALDRLAGTVPPETFPESRALDARRRLRV